jgi:hypothetical protein
VAFTVAATLALLSPRPDRRLWAALAGLAWASAPLLWGQALITEVYGLHALLVAVIGWALLVQPIHRTVLAVALGLAAAHHATSLLLWPAVAYGVWAAPDQEPGRRARVTTLLFLAAVLVAAIFYARIPLAAAGAPPVNWGYADNWRGFWWLVSGAAYRDYFLNMPPAALLGRTASWAQVMTTQFTPVGLALALVGLAELDRQRPRLRTMGLLWLLPVILYAIAYATTDSEVYLLPALWMMALWFANGLAVGVDWLHTHGTRQGGLVMAVVTLAGIAVAAAVRLPAVSLRDDRAAEDYLRAAAVTLQPDSLVLSSADAETFALWYGEWGGGGLDEQRPGLVLVNVALYQFDWYRRLLAGIYPDVPGMGGSLDGLIAANAPLRPIYATEPLPELTGALTAEGRFWRLQPANGEP